MNGLGNSCAFFLAHPIAKRQYLRTAGRILRWQVLSRMQSEITLPWIEESRLTVSRGTKGATGNLYYGLHEFAPMAFTLHILRPKDLFVDGGANVGTYTILASALSGAKTVAFEPDPATTEQLTTNLEKNRLASKVSTHATALGDRSGRVSFTTGLGTMNHVSDQGEETVTMNTLDSFSLAPTLIKLDLENGERSALKGAQKTLRNPALLAVICEDNSSKMAELFGEFGFERYGYEPFKRRLYAEPRALPENGIFIRDIEAVVSRISTAIKVSVFGELV